MSSPTQTDFIGCPQGKYPIGGKINTIIIPGSPIKPQISEISQLVCSAGDGFKPEVIDLPTTVPGQFGVVLEQQIPTCQDGYSKLTTFTTDNANLNSVSGFELTCRNQSTPQVSVGFGRTFSEFPGDAVIQESICSPDKVTTGFRISSETDPVLPAPVVSSMDFGASECVYASKNSNPLDTQVVTNDLINFQVIALILLLVLILVLIWQNNQQ